jgi:hypothetical protein
MLPIQFNVIDTLTIRTTGRSLGTALKAVIFVKRGGLDRNVLSLFLALSVLMKHKAYSKTDGARTGLARLEGRK